MIEEILGAGSATCRIVCLPENLGICGGLQQALDLASGKYFFPFASDDVMVPGRVKLQCDQFDLSNSATHIAAGAVSLIGPDGAPISGRFGRPSTIRPPHYGDASRTRDLACRPMVPPAPGMAFRTAALRQIGGYDLAAPYEDIDTFMRLVLLANSEVVTTNSVVSLYRRHDSNASSKHEMMANGLEHTLRTLIDSGVDLGGYCERWAGYLEARKQGYSSPWGSLLGALRADPLDRPNVRAAAMRVLKSRRMSKARRIKAGLAAISPSVASRRIGA